MDRIKQIVFLLILSVVGCKESNTHPINIDVRLADKKSPYDIKIPLISIVNQSRKNVWVSDFLDGKAQNISFRILDQNEDEVNRGAIRTKYWRYDIEHLGDIFIASRSTVARYYDFPLQRMEGFKTILDISLLFTYDVAEEEEAGLVEKKIHFEVEGYKPMYLNLNP